MGELHAHAHLEQPGVRGRRRRVHLEAEHVGGAAEQHQVAEGLRGRGQDQQPGIGREQLQTLRKAVFDLAGHRPAAGQPVSPGVTRRRPGARQLEQGKRVAVAFRDDLVDDGRVERAVHVAQQQPPCVAVPEAADRQRGQPGQHAGFGPRAGRVHQRDPLGQQASGHETDDLRGGVVEPLRVVDDTRQRALLGGLRQQRQRGQADQEAVGRRTGAQPEHRGERVALRGRQLVEAVQQGGAQLMQAAVGQLHLRLRAYGATRSPTHPPSRSLATRSDR